MANVLTGKQASQIILDEWNKVQPYMFHDPVPSNIQLMSGSEEMLRIAADGFYVRGVRVPADEKEAETVYNAFKQWLAWANLQRR